MAHAEEQERTLIPRARASKRLAISSRQIGLATAYAVVGTGLLWSRFAEIKTSLWHDEIYTVQHFIDPGPSAIFGAYNPNDHVLFSLLGWLTVHSTGLGDSAYRLWSIVPFIVGVVLVTFWLHKRGGAFSAVAFAFLCTTSTLLVTLSIEARGYGLAFLEMAVMTIAAYEALTRPSNRSLTVLAAAGVLGCWTLPTFILPLFGVSSVLLRRRALRRPLAARLVVALLAIGCWYAVPARDLLSSSGQQFGVPLPWHAPFTGAADTLAAAFLLSINAAALLPALLVMPVLIAGILKLRRELPVLALITVVPVVFTFTALTISRLYVEERFISFLLVPILIVAAFGLQALVTPRPALGWVLSAMYVGALVATLLLVFTVLSPQFTRMPREANRDAARAVSSWFAKAPRPVIMNTPHPADVRYYLRHILPRTVRARDLEQVLCSQSVTTTGVIFVQQPHGVDPVNTSCLTRRGAKVQVFRQWDRGLHISVWELPPRTGDSGRT